MNNYHQRKLYLELAIESIVILAFSLLLLVNSSISVYQNNTFKNNIFEMFYYAFHIIVCILAIYLCFMAHKKKGFILSGLLVDSKGKTRKVLQFIGLAVAIIFSVIFVGALLIEIKAIDNFTNFPIFLLTSIMGASLIWMLLGYGFFRFPFAYFKDEIVNRKIH